MVNIYRNKSNDRTKFVFVRDRPRGAERSDRDIFLDFERRLTRIELLMYIVIVYIAYLTVPQILAVVIRLL